MMAKDRQKNLEITWKTYDRRYNIIYYNNNGHIHAIL
jgi:hypothetical protein